MSLIEELNLLLHQLEKISWVDKVKPKWHPPEGLFTEDPQIIAKTIAKASKDYKQAVARVNFFYNRYGCSGERKNDPICKKRTKVLQLLRKCFKVGEKEASSVVLTYDGSEFSVVFPSGSVLSFKDEPSLLRYIRSKQIRTKDGTTGQDLIDLLKEQSYLEAVMG